MALDAFKNLAVGTLSTGYAAGVTSMVLTTGHGARMPAGAANYVIWNSTDFTNPADDTSVEIVRGTISSDTLGSITRGVEGTSDVAHNTGGKTYSIMATLTAKTLNTDLAATFQGLDATLTSLAAYNTNGLITQTAADTFTGRTLTGPAAGITVTNGNGVSGNPALALANDLSALEGLSSTGLAARTATDTWAQRTITGTSNQITVTNGDGVSGNPTLSLPTNQQLPTSAPTANGVYALASSAASALSWNTSPNFKGPTPFVNALAPQFFVSNSTATTTGGITSGLPTLVVASASDFVIGQGIYVVGAGAAGAVLETTISNIVGTTFTLAANAGTTVVGAAVGHSDTAGIQAALDFAVSANVGSAGQVFLPPGIYNVSGINIPHECWLVGSGQRNTLLKSIPGATALGVVIMNGTSKGCGLFDIGIDGNKGATPAPVGSGIYITSTLTAGLRDHRIENVTIDDPTLDGVTLTAPGPERVINVYFRNIVTVSAGRHGFNLATLYVTDCFFVTCYAALSGSNGYNILGGTTQFVGCESDDSTADGWVFSGSGCAGNILSGCRAGNNLGHSFFFTGSNTTNTVDAFSYDPRADHVNIAGGTDNHIRVTAVAPFSATNSDSVLDASGGSGNVCHLTWAASAIASTALTGAALASQIIFQNGAYYGASDQTLLDGADLVLGTTTGTKIGTATSQKLGFFNATPIVQNTSTTDLRAGLISLGFFATGGASPLDLNGGAFTAATATLSGLTSGSVVYAGTGGLLSQNNSSLFWDNSNKRLGISTNAPSAPLHSVLEAAGNHFIGDCYVTSSGQQRLRMRRFRGTAAAPRRLNAGDPMLVIDTAGGYAVDDSTAASTSGSVGLFRFLATENMTSTGNGTEFDISTTRTGATSTGQRLVWNDTGLSLVGGGTYATRSTTQATTALNIYNGTDPAGTLTNGVSLFSSSGKLKSADAAGTIGHVLSASAANTVSPTSPNRTLTVDVGGTTYYIHAKTTND